MTKHLNDISVDDDMEIDVSGITIREFIRPNEEIPPTLRSRHAYTYGKCARLLYYTNKYKKILYTQRDWSNINRGDFMHNTIEDMICNESKEWIREQDANVEIPEINGIKYIGTHTDLRNSSTVIEIKPIYTRMAYYQTLLQRFVFPHKKFYILEYAKGIMSEDGKHIIDSNWKKYLVPLKTDYRMSLIYVGRILTSLEIQPPRLPNATVDTSPCKYCLYLDLCWQEPDSTWESFKEQSEHNIQMLADAFAMDLAKSKISETGVT